MSGDFLVLAQPGVQKLLPYISDNPVSGEHSFAIASGKVLARG